MKVSNVPFKGTAEQEAELRKRIAEHKGEKGSLMPIMQAAQEIYGYLPYQVQKIISDETGIPMEKIYGVATFYAQFSMSPKGQYEVSVCLGTACYVKGADKVLDRLVAKLGIQPEECTPDGVFSLTACRCIGACGLAPVCTVNDVVHPAMTPEKMHALIQELREAETV